MEQRLKDRVAIITGAGRGIGRAYALGYADEGAKVVIAETIFENAQKVVQEIENNGGEALAIHTDISDEAGTQEMARKTVERFGKIDILINNAAIYYGIGLRPWDSLSVEEWDRIFEVNVKGTWLCCKAVVPHMQTQGKGKIINISSGTVAGPPGAHLVFHYVCTKGAIMTMTKLLARALGDWSINVNSIAPGLTETEAVLEMPFQPPGGTLARVNPSKCFKRTEMPEDLVGAAVFLGSDDSDFITGQFLVVDGGMWLR